MVQEILTYFFCCQLLKKLHIMTVQNLHVIYASRSFTTSFAIFFIDATHQTFIITEYGDT